MPTPDNGSPNDWKSIRAWLAIGVTVISIVAVTTLASLVVHFAKNGENAGVNAQNVLNSVLPLLGTWVGTILAYYFSKDNFEAATKSVTELAKQITPQEKLKATSSKEKMVPLGRMFVKHLPADKLKLGEVLNDVDNQKKGNRIPILGDKNEPRYILHRSIIDNFLSDLARSTRSADFSALTVQDLLDHKPDMKAMAESFGVIRLDATLADAMEMMGKINNCQDVFVTQTGSKDEEVLGWITNVIIQDNAKV